MRGYAKGSAFKTDERWWIYRSGCEQRWFIFSPRSWIDPGSDSRYWRSYDLSVETFEEAVALVRFAIDHGPDLFAFTVFGLRERGLVV